MARPCASCSSPHRQEIDRKLKSGDTNINISRWLKELDAPITEHAIGRHARDHLGIDKPRGRRPVSGDFLRAVVDDVAERMAAGELAPSIKDGISAQKEINRMAERTADRDLMIRIALALTGNVGYIDGEARDVTPEQEALEAEFRPLLTAG